MITEQQIDYEDEDLMLFARMWTVESHLNIIKDHPTDVEDDCLLSGE